MSRRVIATLDTETTGLPDDETARAYEIGVAVWDVDKDELLWGDSMLFRPDLLTQEGLELAQEISGIDPLLILGAPIAEEALRWWEKKILVKVASLGASTFGAWNLTFDRAMVRRSLYGLLDPVEAWSSDEPWVEYENPGDPTPWGTCWMIAFSDLFVNSLGTRLTSEPGKVVPRFASLSYASKRIGLPPVEQTTQHRALPDAIRCAQIGAAILRGDVQGQPDKPVGKISLSSVRSKYAKTEPASE